MTPQARFARVLGLVASSPLPLFLAGGHGSGKNRAAEIVHELSGRPGRLHRINLASLSASLFESELFGYVKGAFTGAMKSTPGRLVAAGSGSVLLDEIGDVPLEKQSTLLQLLDAAEIVPVGGVEPVQVRARIIVATNRDLAGMVARGEFRADLYQRFAVLPVRVPSLCERVEEIPTLAAEFVAEACALHGYEPRRLSPAVLARLCAYRWPGNVRELRSACMRAVVLSAGALDETAFDLGLDPMTGINGDALGGVADLGPKTHEERAEVALALADAGPITTAQYRAALADRGAEINYRTALRDLTLLCEASALIREGAGSAITYRRLR